VRPLRQIRFPVRFEIKVTSIGSLRHIKCRDPQHAACSSIGQAAGSGGPSLLALPTSPDQNHDQEHGYKCKENLCRRHRCSLWRHDRLREHFADAIIPARAIRRASSLVSSFVAGAVNQGCSYSLPFKRAAATQRLATLVALDPTTSTRLPV
jgi:hypothetical protein